MLFDIAELASVLGGGGRRPGTAAAATHSAAGRPARRSARLGLVHVRFIETSGIKHRLACALRPGLGDAGAVLVEAIQLGASRDEATRLRRRGRGGTTSDGVHSVVPAGRRDTGEHGVSGVGSPACENVLPTSVDERGAKRQRKRTVEG